MLSGPSFLHKLLTRGLPPILALLAQTLCLGLLAFYAEERWTIQDAMHSKWIQCDIEELAEAYVQRVGADASN